MQQKDFVALIQMHSGIIHKVIHLHLDDSDDKKDLYQEIMYQAWKSVKNFRHDSRFSTWLYRVSLNTVLTYNRKSKKLNTSNGIENLEVAPISENSDRSDKLFLAIKRLNDIDKTIVTLHLDDYDNQEIADITGLTKNNVAVKLHRIKESLTKMLNHGS
ncbi:MAG: sigma-70 family RNA polymerase sigma factor [Bacteroidota bacterium]